MLSELSKEHLREEIESFKDELDFIRTILKDSDEVKLFIFSRAMERLRKSMPNDVSFDGHDFSYSAAQSINELTTIIMTMAK